jgi:hypothetical protein
MPLVTYARSRAITEHTPVYLDQSIQDIGINSHDLSCHHYAATRARHAGCRSAIYEGRERFHAKTALPRLIHHPRNRSLFSRVRHVKPSCARTECVPLSAIRSRLKRGHLSRPLFRDHNRRLRQRRLFQNSCHAMCQVVGSSQVATYEPDLALHDMLLPGGPLAWTAGMRTFNLVAPLSVVTARFVSLPGVYACTVVCKMSKRGTSYALRSPLRNTCLNCFVLASSCRRFS